MGVAAAPAAATSIVTKPALLGLPVNVLPVPLPDAYSVVHDRKLHVDRPGVLANDIDADGDQLEARLVKDAAHGHLDLNHDGSFTYEPDHGYTGLDSFTYQAHDGTIGVATVVTLTVTNVAPVGHNDHYTTKEGVKIQVDRPGRAEERRRRRRRPPEGEARQRSRPRQARPARRGRVRLRARPGLLGHGRVHLPGLRRRRPVRGDPRRDRRRSEGDAPADARADAAPRRRTPRRRTPAPTPKPDKTDDPKPDRTR